MSFAENCYALCSKPFFSFEKRLMVLLGSLPIAKPYHVLHTIKYIAT